MLNQWLMKINNDLFSLFLHRVPNGFNVTIKLFGYKSNVFNHFLSFIVATDNSSDFKKRWNFKNAVKKLPCFWHTHMQALIHVNLTLDTSLQSSLAKYVQSELVKRADSKAWAIRSVWKSNILTFWTFLLCPGSQ